MAVNRKIAFWDDGWCYLMFYFENMQACVLLTGVL
jgi:hypothetical protein